MAEFSDRYLNPFTDYGFKKLFGEEVNKNLLLDFLNEVLKEEQGQIRDLTYLKNEHLGSNELDRKAIFDIYCENERGEKFIVELQKTKQNFFKDRTVYYSTFPIREQAKRADWNYELNAVYTIAILDFVFDADKNEPEKYRYDVKLSDIETKKIFYDKLTFIYFEMPKFKKTVEELGTRYEKWLYVIKNLNKLDRIPDKLREKIFEQLFEAAEIAKMTREQQNTYEGSLKDYRDIKNSIDTAREEGEAVGIKKGIKKGIIKGREEGKKAGIEEGKKAGIEEGKKAGIEEGKKKREIEIVVNAHKKGMTVKDICELTGLRKSEIEKIIRNL